MEDEKSKMQAAREALKKKVGTVQTGGKGSMRRKKKVAPKNNNQDAALAKKMGKFGLQPLPDIEEVNFFKDDDTVMHLKRPNIQFSMKEQLVTVNGEAETKDIKSMIPGILSQVGPEQYKTLQNIVKSSAQADDDDDDVPELVGEFDSNQS